jgi:hypothetical protein
MNGSRPALPSKASGTDRFALAIFWIARPERMDDTFPTFLWPLLGIVFLPPGRQLT